MIQNEHVSIKEAAERTGFYDSYHFSRVFKKAYSFPRATSIDSSSMRMGGMEWESGKV